jgi:uncharacterized protein YbcC (UPF0753/DUF2309 family)
MSLSESLVPELDNNLGVKRVEDAINAFRPALPIQNPMPFFVHNNPLQNWEKLPFEKGIEDAVLLYGNAIEEKSRLIWRDLEDFVIPLVLSYFDQGVNRWTTPEHKESLWEWYCDYIETSLTFKSKILKELKPKVTHFREQGSLRTLAEIIGIRNQDDEYWKTDLQTLIFHFKGWSGMIQVLEKNPNLFPLQRYRVSLFDWVAILVTSEEALRARVEGAHKSLWDPGNPLPHQKKIRRRLLKIKQNEVKFYRSFIQRFKEHLAGDAQIKKAAAVHSATVSSPDVQILFCIDDREESLRRALETVNPSYDTYGTVGFFGLDFSLKRPGHVIFQPQCPPVITPRKKAEEQSVSDTNSFLSRLRQFIPHLNESRFTFFEPVLVLALWPLYALALSLRSFAPQVYQVVRDWLRLDHYIEGRNTIHFSEEYSTEERSQIVSDILGGAGMTKINSKLVVVLGHAATTTNNPFQKSYGCGACSGQAGFANAKVFAEFANDKVVREILQEKGIKIEPTVLFVAACHDTCSDQISYAPVDPVHLPTYEWVFDRFKNDIRRALALNINERWQQFGLPKSEGADARAADWSQPRPEFGHTGVTLSIFGPRWLTKGLNLERKAFLVSYDPDEDPDGSRLTYDILNALPVCANINLDYFTSSAFPEALGAGSKLPLNIASGIGLMPGSKGDLRIGLATQMVDRNDPMRLLAFVYCDAGKLQHTLQKSQRLQLVLKNNWIHLIRIDPKTLSFEICTEELRNEFASVH